MATVHAEDVDPKKMPAVKKALDKAEAGVRRNRKAYEEANEKVFAEAKKTLKDEVERLSKAGKPEEAVAVKKIMETLQEDSLLSGGASDVPPGKTRPAATAPARDKDIVVFNGHRYKLFLETVPWDEAKKRCEELGGHMLTIEDRAEQEFLAGALKTFFQSSQQQLGDADAVWLGIAKEKGTGKWLPLNGKPLLFSEWGPTWPHDNHEVAFFPLSNGKWCSYFNRGRPGIYFICEWDK
jgi:hypothetical protein